MIRRVLWTIGLVGFLAGTAFAQLANQTALVGTVTDSSGSVIPGATVVAVNTGTQDTYETYGNAPRNLLRGPGDFVTDVSVIKNVPLAGRTQFQLRGEIYNLFNRPNFQNPNAVFGTANFGRITQTDTNIGMRRLELGGKILF
jgi:hypothetical protein